MRSIKQLTSSFVILMATTTIGYAEPGKFTSGPSFSASLVDCQYLYKPGTECRELLENFAYSKNGIGWEAPQGTITDGASIPTWAQWFIGEPMREEFAKASILHDHYVREEHQVRSYLATQRMFHDALIDSGVGPLKAGMMYAAVLVAGEAWTVIAGKECDLVANCVRNSSGLLDMPSINRISSSYDDIDMENFTRDFAARIEEGNWGPDEIEAFALQERLLRGIATPPPVIREE